MATRINVNVSGFDAINLKQKADNDANKNRLSLTEKEKLKNLKNKSNKAREDELNKRGLSGSGQVFGGKFIPGQKREEFVPRGITKEPVTACYIQPVSFNTLEIQPRLANSPIFVNIFTENQLIPPDPISPYPGPSVEIVRNDTLPAGCDKYSNGDLIYAKELLTGVGCIDTPCWPAFLNGLYYQKYTRLEQASYRSINPYSGTMQYLTLPYDNGKFVLVAFNWFDIHNHYAYAQGYEDLVRRVVIDRFGSACDSPPGGMITEFATYTIQQEDNEFNQKFEAFRCFLVDDYTVRPISTPSGLLQVLKNWSSIDSYQKNILTDVWGQLPSGNYKQDENTVNNITQVDLQISIASFNFTTEPFLALGLLEGYGRSRFNQSSANIATPSIYTAIKDSSIRESVSSNPSIQSINSDFLAYYTQKEVVPSQIAGQKFLASKNQAENILSIAFVPSSLENSQLTETIFPSVLPCTRQPNKLIWNWDDPSYCRRQLISLGFSLGDLS